MKLIGITSIGTYFSPWFPYTIASIYNIVDQLVIVNHGYLLDDLPNMGPLKKVHEWVKRLDANGKVIELTDVKSEHLKHPYPLGTQRAANARRSRPQGEGRWFDVRGLNLTAASEEAYLRGADWVLKIDTDQVCYSDIKSLGDIHKSMMEKKNQAWAFHQEEFVGDIGNGKPSRLANPPPASPFIDTVYLYPALRDTWYLGAGAVANLNMERQPTEEIHCAHLRWANPAHLTEEEKLEHFFGRRAWAAYTNDYGYWSKELLDEAREYAKEKLKLEGTRTDIRAPDVCYYSDPSVYLKHQ